MDVLSKHHPQSDRAALERYLKISQDTAMRNIIELDHPAGDWEKALPLGNGRLGAMVFGQIDDESILLNEETLFYGGPKDRGNPDAKGSVERIRSLLWAGKPEEAAFYAKAALTGTPRYLYPFQPAGILRLFHYRPKGSPGAYRRVLDIDRALAELSFTVEGEDGATGEFRREYFTSLAVNVLAVKISGTAPLIAPLTAPPTAPVSLIANLNRRPFEEHSGRIDRATVGLWGRCGPDGVDYFGAARLIAQGGQAEVLGDALTVRDAESVVIYASFQTSYRGNLQYREGVLASLDEAEKTGYEALKEAHCATYRELYRRVELSINSTDDPESAAPAESTDAMLEKLQQGDDRYLDYLSVLEFNLGRYLLISSSYNCRLPANLQGLWNGTFTPPWESVYTININLEMNYWPAEVCGLSECTAPLFDLVDLAAERGRASARNLYGAGGFVLHHNTDAWGDPDPTGIGDSSPFWVMGGAWLALHYFEHYRYTQDRDFLKNRALPVMEGALQFFLDYLTEDAAGTLHSGPSISPENTYITPGGQRAALCISPAMDIQILRELGKSYQEALQTLGLDHETGRRIAAMIRRLPETKLTKDGRIREWLEDYDEAEPGHRHLSHLFALHPGAQITEESPELFAAAKKTLEYRLSHGGGHTGWSCAWVILFHARLKDGEGAYRYVRQLLSGKTSENMLNVHPPFQIDGNFGFTAAVAEMLVQSHAGYCELLPALPSAWKKGRARGLRVRGGVTLDMAWEGGKLAEALFTADQDTRLSVKYRGKTAVLELKKGVPSPSGGW
ncbi:MAG: glycoside hydrolase family 95 protein [Treponema sp.]|jgi:alpha-L-fucosidase 2|nr:glycoside hydrolase family 95 protein [Treponema sp.]